MEKDINNDPENFSQWNIISEIHNHNTLNKVCIRAKDSRKIVEKSIKLTSENEWRAILEIKLMKSICSPHVVACLGVQESKQSKILRLFMPYYNEGDLEQYLLKHPDLSFSERFSLLLDILVGLKQLHVRFVIHRDLKLNNIFVERKSQQVRAVVGDLGVAKVTERASSEVGTVGYQAPQVYSSRDYDNKIDVWGVGIIAYQLLNPLRSGNIPFPFKPLDESTFQKYKKREYTMQAFDGKVPDKLVKMIEQMLIVNPEKRLSWVSLYAGGWLRQFDQNDRVVAFKADYSELEETMKRISLYVSDIEQKQVNYFKTLGQLLRGENVKVNEQKYPLLKKYKKEMHIFYYHQLKTVIDHFQFIASKNWEERIIELKPIISKVRDSFYEIQDRINLWLRRNLEADIAINPFYLNQHYYQQAKGITDQVLDSILS